MKSNKLLALLVLLVCGSITFAQNAKPFASIGKKGKILTLTKGQYDESFDQDSIQQIGSSLVNLRTMKVIKLLSESESKARLEGEKRSRFLSVDPLTNSFPMLTPYQYASNRPIDGIDMDGGEYLTYLIVNDRQTGKTIMKKPIWFNPTQHNAHGKMGQGVFYAFFEYDYRYKLFTKINYQYVSRNENASIFTYHVYTEYGNYMGATGLKKVGSDGSFTKVYDYDIDAVDAVDNFAKFHDIGYDKLFAVGATGLFDDLGTTPVDEAALNGWKKFRQKYKVGDIDPYNNQKITSTEMNAAWRGLNLFNYVVNNKKRYISYFMQSNYSDKAKASGVEGGNEYNYQLFLNMYLDKDKEGNWIRKKGMWNQNEKGEYTTPKTPEQIKANGN